MVPTASLLIVCCVKSCKALLHLPASLMRFGDVAIVLLAEQEYALLFYLIYSVDLFFLYLSYCFLSFAPPVIRGEGEGQCSSKEVKPYFSIKMATYTQKHSVKQQRQVRNRRRINHREPTDKLTSPSSTACLFCAQLPKFRSSLKNIHTVLRHSITCTGTH